MGAAITIWRFIANDQSNRFFVNNSSRRSSRCPRMIVWMIETTSMTNNTVKNITEVLDYTGYTVK